MDTSRPLHFGGTKFPYYIARMACYLKTVDLGVWRVIRNGMRSLKNLEKPIMSDEKEIHLNARARNCLFESLSMEICNQVFTLKSANEIWLKLHELQDEPSNVSEQKHCLAKQSCDSLKMNENELIHDMYSHLNLTINELSSIGLKNLGDANIVRKIISMLPHHKYACKHYHHSPQHGRLGQHVPGHCHWQIGGI
jgi:hypothetical protein